MIELRAECRLINSETRSNYDSLLIEAVIPFKECKPKGYQSGWMTFAIRKGLYSANLQEIDLFLHTYIYKSLHSLKLAIVLHNTLV